MRAAVVVVLRDLPAGPDGEQERIRAFRAVADALHSTSPQPVQVIATVDETADAVIKAAGGELPSRGAQTVKEKLGL